MSERDQRLRELEQTRRDVRQMVVNDMQPPLMALTFNLMRLKERHTAGCDEEARGALDAAIAAGATINRVSSDLLDTIRIEQDSPPVNPV